MVAVDILPDHIGRTRHRRGWRSGLGKKHDHEPKRGSSLTEHEILWEKLLDLIDRQGILSLRSLKATPGEIARHVRSGTGDNRVHRFVWGYYYPRAFGKEQGSMTENEAKAIIESFNRPLSRVERAVLTTSPEAEPLVRLKTTCQICGTRPTIRGEVA